MLLSCAAPSNVLTIAGAEAAIAAAVQRGAELNFTALNIVVVDRYDCFYGSWQERLAHGHGLFRCRRRRL